MPGDSGEGSENLSDFLTVKYNASGAQQWAAAYSNLYDYATDVALDPSGGVYVTGYSHGFGTSYDYATISYSPIGVQRWVARFHGGLADDYPYDLTTDASGNVYVTGETVESGTGSEYGTIKYNAEGTEQWVARYNGPVASASDRANAVAVDAHGNVYVTGESEGPGTQTDYATLKYDAQGVQQWLARYNGPENTFDIATALAVDTSGSVYVTGRSAYIGGAHTPRSSTPTSLPRRLPRLHLLQPRLRRLHRLHLHLRRHSHRHHLLNLHLARLRSVASSRECSGYDSEPRSGRSGSGAARSAECAAFARDESAT